VKEWTANVAVNEQNVLGEGTLWDEAQKRLWWVDIYGKRLFCYNPQNRTHVSFDLPEVAGTVVIRDDGRPLLAQGCGLSTFDPETRAHVRLADVERRGSATHRLNDGKCDPLGRLWVGSIVEQGEPGNASLFCVDARGRVVSLIDGVTISNGLVWTDGGRLFYYIDTPTQQVWAYDCNLSTLQLTNRRVVFEFPKEMGSPDGMTIDEEGQLWVALFGGRGVVRLDPERGELTGRVSVAAKNVTSCAFGGANRSTLYISTATLATTPEELQQFPTAGALFEVELPTRGLVSPRFSTT
jgi:sugar lactone lactonase YvrE